MLGLRREVSLLLSQGHPHARRYSIIMVWNEAEIVQQRYNRRVRDYAIIGQHLATLSTGTLTKDGVKKTNKALRTLLEENFHDS